MQILNRLVALAVVLVVTCLAGLGIAAGQSDDSTLAADQCPEQTAALRSVGIVFDQYTNDDCPAVDDVYAIVAERRADLAKAA